MRGHRALAFLWCDRGNVERDRRAASLLVRRQTLGGCQQRHAGPSSQQFATRAHVIEAKRPATGSNRRDGPLDEPNRTGHSAYQSGARPFDWRLFRLVEPGGAAETAATLVRARGPPRWVQVTALRFNSAPNAAASGPHARSRSRCRNELRLGCRSLPPAARWS